MSENKLKEAMEQVHIAEQMQEDIVRNVCRQMNAGEKRVEESAGIFTGKWRFAMIAAAAALLVGIACVPVKALVSYYRNMYENPNVKARVETTMSEEEIQALFRMFDIQDKNGVNADSFSREFIGTEEERNKALWKAYKEGSAYPEGSILMVDTEEEAEKHEFCYLTILSKYYLPKDRELTDEELLQKIDLQIKSAYVIEKRYFEGQGDSDSQE